jgi:hypothetical protein
MSRDCSTHGAKVNAHNVFVGRPEGERPIDGSVVGRRILK